MAKEILLYGRMHEYSIRDFFSQVAEAVKEDPNAELHFRINSEGGNPEYTWGAICRMIEAANKKIKVDAMAHSMWAIGLCYFDEVEATDVSQFVLHRAAYPDWFESDPRYFNTLLQENLKKVNADLEKALRARIDVAMFEEMKGVKIRELFSMESRVEVLLSVGEAKKIGLVKTITKITPTKKAEIDAKFIEATEKYGMPLSKAANNEIVNPIHKNNKTMTLEEFKSQHPAIYAQIITESKAAGATEERARIQAWEGFRHIDAEAVNKGISEGRTVTGNDIANFTAKALSPEALKKLSAESAAPVTTGEDASKASTEKEKKVASFEDEVKANLGIKK